jgi:hypothetical protein
LTGTVGLKLDDGYPSPVQSEVILNFAQTSGTDELSFSIDEAAGAIQLQNRSPFDLSVKRCALGIGQTITVVDLGQTIATGASATIPLPVNHAGIAVVADAQLALPSPATKDDLARYLTFQVQDVQDTQFELAVNASGVDFDGKGIHHIDVQVTFPALPDIVPAPMALYKLHTADGTQVLIPIQNAVTQLLGTASFTVYYFDAAKQPAQFTLQNDFCENALLVVSSSDIP